MPAGRMRKIIIASCLALVLGVAAPVRADTSLTAAVAAAYFPRTVDADLHAIAHERVLEISACSSCFDHGGIRAGTAEVLGYNSGYSAPISEMVDQWQSSSEHDGILSDGSYGRIGCAERSIGGEHWFVCVLATGGSSARLTSGGGGTAGIPDTAMPAPR
jgi:hypothetical protein